MAMGSRGRREAENAIASCRPFRNSTGSMKGTQGSTRTLGWLENHTDARHIRELLSRAVYVVWSYGTPIAWVSETEDGDRQAYYVDKHHSTTTSHHQGVARVGLGEYETIGERRPVRRPRRERRTSPDAMVVRAEMRYRTAENEVVSEDELARRARGMTPAQLLAEAERGREQWMAEQRRIDERAGLRFPTPASATAAVEGLAGSPGYQNGLREDHQQATLQQMLDPRYADPDWTPWGYHGGLPEGAHVRDEARVERENAERPWRP